MDNIIAEVEADPRTLPQGHRRSASRRSHHLGRHLHGLRRTASILPVKAIVTYTTSGWTTLRAARERPAAPVVALTPDIKAARRLTLVWGTYPIERPQPKMLSEIVENTRVQRPRRHALPERYHCHRRRHAVRRGRHHRNLLRIARLESRRGSNSACPRSRDLRQPRQPDC